MVRRDELTPSIVAKSIKRAGWLLQNFITIATTISATGLTVLDTLWYKPYESAFTALEHHSIVASSRQTGILMWATDCNGLLGFDSRLFSLAARRYGLHFLDVSEHLQATVGIPQDMPDMMIAAFAKGMEKTVAYALGKPTWQEGVHFPPGTRAGVAFNQGYHGAHQAFLADLSVNTIAWEHVPNILLFTSIPPNTNKGGVTVVLFPVPRVAHLWSSVEDIPAQFVINQHTTWIWIGGAITKKGAQYQLVPMLSLAKRTPLLVVFRHGKKVATHYAPQGVKGLPEQMEGV